MNAKLTPYARREIQIYIIIDRCEEGGASSDRRPTRKRDPKVLVCTLETTVKKKKYRVREYRGSQKISSPFFGETTARGLLNPPETWVPVVKSGRVFWKISWPATRNLKLRIGELKNNPRKLKPTSGRRTSFAKRIELVTRG